MKRLLTLLLTAVMALAAYPAFAAVNNTPHDFLNSTYGRCGTCHLPHAAQGAKRLWQTAITPALDLSWAGSTVGSLCADCHAGGSQQNVDNVNGQHAGTWNNATNVYVATSHGRDWRRLTGAPLSHTPADTNGKPYLTTATQPEDNYIECTSCHNPHYVGSWDTATNTNNVNRPFLRPGATSAGTVSGFCNDCHDDRFSTTVIGNTANHPVLAQYNPGADNTRSFIQAVPAMNVVVGVNNWSLGGKFEGNILTTQANNTSALIGCQSCHSIHAPAAAANADGTAMGGTPRQLLAVTYGNSAVCEGCHEARGNGGAIGNGGGDHPYDAALVGVMVMDGAYWAGTEKGGGAIAGGAICTSCHKAHIASGGVSYIRRAGDGTNWCVSCHTSVAPAAHHSNSTQLGTSDINCIDCHSGTGATAHNGFGYVFSAAGGCLACHGGVDPVTAAVAGGVANMPNAHITTKNGGGAQTSHFLGTFVNNATKGINVKTGRWSTDAIRGGRISAYLKNADGTAMIADKSCYNDTAGVSATLVIRCESCHSVLGNIGATTGIISVSSGWMNNLLLQDYQDDSAGQAAARGVNSDFCIGCHNKISGDDAARKLGGIDGIVGNSLHKDSAVTPPGIHPMTGWVITRAVDAGRTPTTLITGAGSYADASGAPAAGTNWVGTNGVSYPGADLMDCDSCHRPHVGNLSWTPTNETIVGRGAVPVILEDSSASDYAALCQDCHAY